MKERLDVLVVSRGLAPSREKAKAIIMAGNVLVDGPVSYTHLRAHEMCWLTDREKIRRAPCLKTLWKSP